MKNKNNKNKGFSIIEVIVASMLLSVCVIVVMDAFVIGAFFKKNTERAAAALFLAQAFMEISLTDTTLTDMEGDCPEPYEDYKYKIKVKNVPDSALLQQVDVEVSISSGHFNKTVKLSAFKQQ